MSSMAGTFSSVIAEAEAENVVAVMNSRPTGRWSSRWAARSTRMNGDDRAEAARLR